MRTSSIKTTSVATRYYKSSLAVDKRLKSGNFTKMQAGMAQAEEERLLSIRLHKKMCLAGFYSSNARVQSAMALVIEYLLRFLLKLDNLHVFGSYSDGLGSCLKKLDGTIDPKSDIDLTIMVGKRKLHPVADPEKALDCPAGEIPAIYTDGHVKFSCGEKKPNFEIEKSRLGMLSAFDIIAAVECTAYPTIELLQEGYKTRKGEASNVPERILQQLRAEVLGNSPRCHAVAASPPTLPEGSCMRVSTTLLERSVMHNLNDIQGQFFIILKYIIKMVVKDEAAGLKTYMAKNLLFYMIDEIPEEAWKPENLLFLVREALKMLMEMMEQEESEHVCMKHFFLRDANVYLKKEHKPKTDIVKEVNRIVSELSIVLENFCIYLTEAPVREVQFHALFSLHLIGEICHSPDQMSVALKAFSKVRDAHNYVIGWSETSGNEVQNDQSLQSLLSMISQLPQCVPVTKEWLTALTYQRYGFALDETTGRFEFPISRGIPCPHPEQEVQIDEAKTRVLAMLAAPNPMSLQVRNGTITACGLQNEASLLASLFESVLEGKMPETLLLLKRLADSGQLKHVKNSMKDTSVRNQQAVAAVAMSALETLSPLLSRLNRGRTSQQLENVTSLCDKLKQSRILPALVADNIDESVRAVNNLYEFADYFCKIVRSTAG